MKKTVALIVALLSCSLVCSQAANSSDDSSSSYGEFVIAPRLDGDVYSSLSSKEAGIDLGLSSLYTFFDGEIGEHFSFSLSNHWLSAEPGSLYQNSFRTDQANWLDWANVTASFGNFYATVGKDIMALAIFEEEPNDVDSHYQINSILWNNFQVYQWGATAGWTSNDEATNAGFQFSTSPFGEKPFTGHYAYTVFGSHEFETVCLKAAATFLPSVKQRLYTLGTQFNLPECSLGLDAFYDRADMKGVIASFNKGFSEKLELTVKAGFDSHLEENDTAKRFVGGAVLHWFPIDNSRDLRFHAMAGFERLSIAGEKSSSLSASIGVTYFLNITVF